MEKKQLRNSVFLLLTAVIWGVAFVAQSVGMDYVGPFTFNCVRSIIGGIFLIPCIIFLRYLKKQEKNRKISGMSQPCGFAETGKPEKAGGADGKRWPFTRVELIGGCCCGTALFAASNFQQVGIMHTTVGKAGFITALYVVIVPIMGLFLKKKASWLVWVSVVLSVVGLYLLCMTSDSLSLSRGDFLVLICAILFSIHIMVIDYFSPKGDGVIMSCIQFVVSGILSGILMLLYETPSLSAVLSAWMPILYAGILSCGVAYTLQVVGQEGMNPTVASLILCLESVISALAGWVILHQALSARELSGCILMFSAIVLAQLPLPSAKKKKRT